jgi:hypothetical protein
VLDFLVRGVVEIVAWSAQAGQKGPAFEDVQRALCLILDAFTKLRSFGASSSQSALSFLLYLSVNRNKLAMPEASPGSL